MYVYGLKMSVHKKDALELRIYENDEKNVLIKIGIHFYNSIIRSPKASKTERMNPARNSMFFR